MIWDRLMALFCRYLGHASEYEDFHRYCVRCGAYLARAENTSDAVSRRWPK